MRRAPMIVSGYHTEPYPITITALSVEFLIKVPITIEQSEEEHYKQGLALGRGFQESTKEEFMKNLEPVNEQGEVKLDRYRLTDYSTFYFSTIDALTVFVSIIVRTPETSLIDAYNAAQLTV